MIGASLFSTLLLGVSSCNKEDKDSKEVAKEENKEKFDDRDDKKDANFLVAAAENDLVEIELGKLAQTKGVSAHVKELGKLLETQHTESLNKVKDLAGRKNISIPTAVTEKGQDKYEKLNKETGNDFDEKFIETIADAHKDAIDKFEKAAKDADDEEIRTFATAQLPILNEHLGHAKAAESNHEHKEDAKKDNK